MKRFYLSCAAALIASGIAAQTLAHQPIMDMTPRWNNGYGVQIRNTHANSTTTNWLEGVYTFKPAVRMTLKVPFIENEKGDSETGDAIFAVPLKRYQNKGAFTANWGFTPSVRMPTGGGSKWQPGLSISYASETPKLYQLYDVYSSGNSKGIDINIGSVHANGRGSSWFTLWDVSGFDSATGQRILTGPVLVYFKRNIVGKAVFKTPVIDNDSAWDGDFFSIGAGIVF